MQARNHSLLLQQPNPVVFAVANEDRIVFVDKYAMRPSQTTLKGVAVGAIGLFPITHEKFKRFFRDVDHADRVRFGIRQIDIAFGIETDALGAGECCAKRRSTIASEA